MKESQDAGKYQVNNDKTVQGQIIGDHPTVHQHFYSTQDKATSLIKPQQLWNIPYLRNDYFTGREEILAQLHTRFQANHATALSQRHAMSGLGGIGKTQTAVEYAYRYHEEYQAVLWARAESHEALTSSFVEIARLLDLPQKDEQDQTMIVQAMKRWLQENSGWLLILDNADEPKIVREFLPTKFDGHIFLTTRAQALGGLAQRIEVDTFTPELGALFLLRRTTMIGAGGALDDAVQSDREIAMEISKELGGLPLALDQAGAYIEKVQCSLSDYLDLYRTRRAEMLKERGGLMDDHPDSVATTWSLSFQRVEEKNPAAADLLRLCAFLAPDAIPEEIITKGAEHLGPVLQAAARDPMALNKAIAALGAYSLIRRIPTKKTLNIHRLVQAVLCDAMSEDEAKMWAEQAVRAVSEACPDAEFEAWQQWERYLSHALACAELVEQGDLIFAEATHLIIELAVYLPLIGEDTKAESLLQHALAIREQQLGREHPDTVQCLNNLILFYYDSGDDNWAEPLLGRILAIRDQQIGTKHPNMSSLLTDIAHFFDTHGKDGQVEPLIVRALTISKQLGPLHPDMASILYDLAGLYITQGKYDLARRLRKHALVIYVLPFRPKDWNMVSDLRKLAFYYHDRKKDEQAEPLFRYALTVSEAHDQGIFDDLQLQAKLNLTVQSLNDLAIFYYDQEKYEQAEPLYQRALDIHGKVLGSEHPGAKVTRQNYADLLQAMGRDEEAKQIEEGNDNTEHLATAPRFS